MIDYWALTTIFSPMQCAAREMILEKDTGFAGWIKFLFGCIPLALTAFFLVLGLISFFTDAAPTVHLRAWMQSQPGLLKTILQWTLGMVVDLVDLLLKNPVIFWIGTVILTFLGLLGGLVWLEKFVIVKKANIERLLRSSTRRRACTETCETSGKRRPQHGTTLTLRTWSGARRKEPISQTSGT